MSTKNIAVNTRVYDRLAAAKSDGESFSRAIDRLLNEIEAANTGSDILRRLEKIPPLSANESEIFMKVIAGNRALEDWDTRDLR